MLFVRNDILVKFLSLDIGFESFFVKLIFQKKIVLITLKVVISNHI